MFMAILRMVLVINSSQILWTYICWITNLLSNSNGKQYATITWQTMKKGSQLFPSAFECVSEYTLFIAFTMICMVLNTIILAMWMPISGLLWWYKFYKNVLDDADGRSLLDILNNPTTGYPHKFLLPHDRNRNPRLYRDRFPGRPLSEPMLTCFSPINHRENLN